MCLLFLQPLPTSPVGEENYLLEFLAAKSSIIRISGLVVLSFSGLVLPLPLERAGERLLD